MFLKLLSIFVLSFGVCWNYGVVQNFYWRPYTPDHIPPDALEAADGKLIGLVCHTRGELIATIYPRSGIVVAVQDNKVMLDNANGVKLFCSSTPERYYWEKVNFTTIKTEMMNHAVQAGYYETYKSNVYIGRTYDLDEWKIGMVIPIDNKDNRGLWVWNEKGEKKKVIVFDLLKYNASFKPLLNVTQHSKSG